jgi:hypothetical protein
MDDAFTRMIKKFIAWIKLDYYKPTFEAFEEAYSKIAEVQLVDEVCPGCGAKVVIYQPGHDPSCWYSYERNNPKPKEEEDKPKRRGRWE